MTAINVIRQSNAVHLVADGLSYGPPGQRLHPSTKLWPLPHLPAIVAARGPKLLPPILADILGSTARSYDDIRATIGQVLKAYLPQITAMMQALPGAHADLSVFELIVAGISQHTGPDYFFFTVNENYRSLSPWTVHDLGDLAMIPLTEAMEDEARTVFAERNIEDLTVFDGIRMCEIQRRNWPADLGHQLPGAFIQAMTLDASGLIRTGIIHRWPADREQQTQAAA